MRICTFTQVLDLCTSSITGRHWGACTGAEDIRVYKMD